MNFSVSQVEKAMECFRKWAYGSVHGQWVNDSNRDTTAGDELHDHLEGRVKLGLPIDTSTPMGRLAKLAEPYLPGPADDPTCEERMVVSYGRHGFGPIKADVMWESPLMPVVMDYKTVKSFRWALSKPKLRQDLAANVYARAAMEKYDVETVTCFWLYLKRPDPKAPDEEMTAQRNVKPVSVEIHYEDTSKVLNNYLAIMDEMAEAKAKKLPIADTRYEINHCSAYGGCRYVERCFPQGT